MKNDYGSLSLEQQGKLMRQIDELARVDGDEHAKECAKELIDFLFALESHCFITPPVRVRYLQGIENAMRRRRKKNA